MFSNKGFMLLCKCRLLKRICLVKNNLQEYTKIKQNQNLLLSKATVDCLSQLTMLMCTIQYCRYLQNLIIVKTRPQWMMFQNVTILMHRKRFDQYHVSTANSFLLVCVNLYNTVDIFLIAIFIQAQSLKLN